MKKVLIVFFLLAGFHQAQAATTVGGYAACFTEESYDEIIQMAARQDRRGFEYMISSKKCVVLKSGLQISILDLSFTRAKIRVYIGDDSAVVWTVREGVKQ